ncbi:ATP-dependent endonuclease [Streptomyces sp. NPDC058613]|uniref:ATP-dependent nuclease n=1 Tax=Streptomyces sp. NPDC058613 TaxID=3346556 RepID=UPI00365DB6CD
MIEQQIESEKFSISISRIKLPSGDVKPPKLGVTAFVGPNNVGKSTILRQIAARSTQGFAGGGFQGEPILVEDLDFAATGTEEEMISWFESHSGIRTLANGVREFLRPSASGVTESDLCHMYRRGWPQGFQTAQSHIMLYGDAWSRISSIAPVQMRDQFDNPAVHPIHRLQDQPELFDELSSLCMQVFGVHLTLDTLSMSQNIRIGSLRVEIPPVNKVSPEYREALASLPMLQNQGDGMRSFIGLMLPLLTSTYQTILLDEPEAFLHPPQAFQLGKVLGEQARQKGTQVILATHDRNLLAGLLQSESDVSIVRLDRGEGDANTSRQLSVENLRKIWSDPVLRHSNTLDALFHKVAILAEGDRDCTFYAAALEYWSNESTQSPHPADALFIPSGGKGGLPLLVEVLRSAAVPVVATPDLDVLNNKDTLKKLVAKFGGDWSEFEKDYDVATEPFRAPRSDPTVAEVLASLNALFGSRSNDSFTAAVANEFKGQLRARENPWNALKVYGEAAWAPNPQAAAAAQRLLGRLDRLGIVTVRVGELERFAPTLEVRKGPEWTPAAIREGYHKTDQAQRHVDRMMQSRPVAPSA